MGPTPRSVISLGSLFVASFLATWWVVVPGSMPLAGAVRTTAQIDAALGPWRDPVEVEGTTGVQPTGSNITDLPEIADPPADFDAAARDATAAPTLDERLHAVQLLGEAPAQVGIDTLVAVSAQGVDERERATAITALRQRLVGSGADERIRDAFRRGALDPDPLVAVLAQSALEDIQR
jgi:hypothetical protein